MPDARRFAAVFLTLRTPGLAPPVREGFGRYPAAHAHPAGPRVPEALHLAIRATRYGPGNQDTAPSPARLV